MIGQHLTSRCCLRLLLLTLVSMAYAVANEPAKLRAHRSLTEISFGQLSTFAHQVQGEVVAVSERVLEIRNFVYDGAAPAAYIWADTNPTPSDSGFALLDGSPSNHCGTSSIGGADGTKSWQVEMPDGMTIADIAGGSISVWCKQFAADFGHVVVPASLVGLTATADGPALQCSATNNGNASSIPAIAVTPDGYNCESLDNDLQVRWLLEGDTIAVELVGRISETDYMGFGPSGSDDTTNMIGADPTICDTAADGTFRARDFSMNDRSQCSNGVGVCSDTVVQGGVDNVSNTTGERDLGLTLVRYKRPVNSTDDNDRPFLVTPGSLQSVVWAIGPVDPGTGNPLFHSNYPRGGVNVQLEFGRAAADNCEPLVTSTDGGTPPTAAPVAPFVIPSLRNITEFTANIGPSGGPKGFAAITGKPSWGIAWYVNDLLAPIIEMQRGTTYTFRVSGGNNPETNAQYHPFYLTTGVEGGYAQLTPAERAAETVFAGIEILETDANGGVTRFNSTAAAPICEYQTTNATQGALNGTFQDYFATLDTSCNQNETTASAAAVFEFTPNETTPSLIYYQCVTHRNLGYKIRVLNPGETLSPTVAPVAQPVTARTDTPVSAPSPATSVATGSGINNPFLILITVALASMACF